MHLEKDKLFTIKEYEKPQYKYKYNIESGVFKPSTNESYISNVFDGLSINIEEITIWNKDTKDFP